MRQAAVFLCEMLRDGSHLHTRVVICTLCSWGKRRSAMVLQLRNWHLRNRHLHLEGLPRLQPRRNFNLPHHNPRWRLHAEHHAPVHAGRNLDLHELGRRLLRWHSGLAAARILRRGRVRWWASVRRGHRAREQIRQSLQARARYDC